MSVNNSQSQDDTIINYHPLTTLAVELQTRLETFKRDFNTFYAQRLRSYRKWRTGGQGDRPRISSIVFILDKVLPKANFLQKFTLGRMTAYKSEHTVELTYVAPNSNTASSLVRTIRTGQPGQAPGIIIKTTTRDLRSLAILVDPTKESAWGK